MSRSPMLTVRLDSAAATIGALREYVDAEIAETQRLLARASDDERTQAALLQLVGRLEAYLSIRVRLDAKPRRSKASPSPSAEGNE